MRSKSFEYFHKDIKQLKTDITFRIIFSIMFLGIFVWQLVSMLLIRYHSEPTRTQTIVSYIVLISSLVLCWTTLAYAIKDCRIVATINDQGKCVSSVNILFSTDKASFVKIYQGLLTFLTVGISLLLVACITYSILEISFFSTISFYMPLLFLICVAGYNSIYHVRDEILTQQSIQEQRPLY